MHGSGDHSGAITDVFLRIPTILHEDGLKSILQIMTTQVPLHPVLCHLQGVQKKSPLIHSTLLSIVQKASHIHYHCLITGYIAKQTVFYFILFSFLNNGKVYMYTVESESIGLMSFSVI